MSCAALRGRLASLPVWTVTRRARAILLGGFLLVATASPAIGAKIPPLTLTVASSALTYDVGEQVSLTVTLTNTSMAPIAVTTFDLGTIGVVKVERNGVKIHPAPAVVEFDEDPNIRRVEALMILMPGDHVAVPLDVDPTRARPIRRP